MRSKTQVRLRYFAWLCVVAVLLAAAAPGAAGLPQAILAPAGPILCEPSSFNRLRGAEESRPPDLLVSPGLAARAPPLA